MIFTISLLTSCRTVRTTEDNTQQSKEKSEQVKETHQKEDNKTILNMQADSVIIEENRSESDDSLISDKISLISENSPSSVVKIPHKAGKRTIKIYGLHKNVTSNNQIVSKEKVQEKKKGTIKTTAKTKEEKLSSNGTFIGIVIVLLCLLMIAGFVYWKIAVQ